MCFLFSYSLVRCLVVIVYGSWWFFSVYFWDKSVIVIGEGENENVGVRV